MATRKTATKSGTKVAKLRAALRAADKSIGQSIRDLQKLQKTLRDAANALPPGGGGDLTNRPGQ